MKSNDDELTSLVSESDSSESDDSTDESDPEEDKPVKKTQHLVIHNPTMLTKRLRR